MSATSVVWQFFEKEVGNERMARCLRCSKLVPRGKPNSAPNNWSTNSLRNHANNEHRAEWTKVLAGVKGKAKAAPSPRLTTGQFKDHCQQASIREHMLPHGTKVWKATDPRTKKTNQKVLQFIVQDNQPFSVVEDDGFIQLVAHINPCYPVPSRKHITSLLDPEYQRVKGLIQKDVNTATFVSFTTDIWTEDTTKHSFISLSAHWLDSEFVQRDYCLEGMHFPVAHTGENISGIMTNMLEDWQIDSDRWGVVVRDGASNAVKGSRLMNISSIHCTIHLLQLAVQDGVLNQSRVKTLVNLCRGIVNFLHRSAKATASFIAKQKEIRNCGDAKCLKLVGDVVTRWNSTYLLLERFVKLKSTVQGFLYNTEVIVSTKRAKLDDSDFTFMEKVCTILYIFIHVDWTLPLSRASDFPFKNHRGHSISIHHPHPLICPSTNDPSTHSFIYPIHMIQPLTHLSIHPSNQVCTILKPFFDLTLKFSSNTVSLADVIPNILCLRKFLDVADASQVRTLVDSLTRAIEDRFFSEEDQASNSSALNVLKNPVYTNATLLHPSYRQVIPHPFLKDAKTTLLSSALRLPSDQDESSEGIFFSFYMEILSSLSVEYIVI